MILYRRGYGLQVGDLVRSRVNPQDTILEVVWVGNWRSRKRGIGVRTATGEEFTWQQSRPPKGGDTQHRDDFLSWWVEPKAERSAARRSA